MIALSLKVNAARSSLAVTWDDGVVSHLPAPVLRAHSRAAIQVRADLYGPAGTFDDVMLTGAEPIGAYAVRLVFSDGHDRGIYPWSYLRTIAEAQL
ncbi:DUF971 domain-containing protein [Sinorhizobium sp. RAC02]|uniref:gamma-butyrobetaine hydroxylase-like domain-containing protein n=1 Tax=Sinorhizobium sp. RAC02 TaxID=1842534 RepID=UPI00083E15B8|nr:DUF971 domain-containing protein [Sinorhizobium sp. RAC02]AOF92749.1 hypothetical protein BSY16_4735 [Sinorhizobium sp. RAC02]